MKTVAPSSAHSPAGSGAAAVEGAELGPAALLAEADDEEDDEVESRPMQ